MMPAGEWSASPHAAPDEGFACLEQRMPRGAARMRAYLVDRIKRAAIRRLHRSAHGERWILRLYLIGGTVLVPAVLAAFYILVQHKHIIILPFSNISAGRGLVLYIILSVVLTTASFFFHRWYIFKLYGRYIQRLKQTLEEMNG